MRKFTTGAVAFTTAALVFLPLLLAVGAGLRTGDLPWT